MEICDRSVYDDHWVVRREGFKSNLEMATFDKAEGCQIVEKDIFVE